MYRLTLGDKIIGVFEKVTFTKRSPSSGCFISCSKSEADGVVADGKIYAITNSEDYKEYDHVAVEDIDGEIERSAELDYIRVMSNLV